MDLTPALSQLLIINAGGFGRTIAGIAQSDAAHGVEWQVAGYLDGRGQLAATSRLPIVGDPVDYRIRPGELFLCALGDPRLRRQYAAPLLAQGATFMNLLTRIDQGDGVRFGAGCVCEPDVKMGVDCAVGDFVLIQANSIVGYEVSIGGYTTIGSMVFIGGRARIGSDVVIHPHSTILPGVRIGDGAVVGAGSVVVGNVPAGVTVMGNPAKRFRFK